ncbi:MAG: hypothetical protein JKY66_11050 [Spongiibacteraceae bacterium]|nr:hypothetical protein [Spongiibacteraceae bacterium]
MLFSKWPRAITVILFCLCISTPINAQTLQSLKNSLAESGKRIDALNAEQERLYADISTNNATLTALSNTASPEKVKYEEAKIQLDQATEDHRSKRTSKSKAIMSNAAFKHALAERRYKKANTNEISLQEKNTALNNKLTKNTNRLDALNRSHKQYEKKIALKSTELARSQQALKEKNALQQQRAAEAEILSLKAALAQKDSPPSIAIQAKLPTKQVVLPTPKPITPTIANTATAKPPEKTSASIGGDIVLLSTKEQVKEEEQRLKDLDTKLGKKRSRYNKVLNIKTARSNGSLSRAKANTLRALGNKQYQAVVRLKHATFVFSIGDKQWRATTPKTFKNTKYVFIYDETNTESPRLLYFDKSLSAR